MGPAIGPMCTRASKPWVGSSNPCTGAHGRTMAPIRPHGLDLPYPWSMDTRRPMGLPVEPMGLPIEPMGPAVGPMCTRASKPRVGPSIHAPVTMGSQMVAPWPRHDPMVWTFQTHGRWTQVPMGAG
eukprot:1951652-Prymnesium_polylepis.1